MDLKTTSSAGRAAIIQREGCSLKAYLDSVGVPTIGVGHTGRASPPIVTLGMTITQAQADAFLAADLAPFERAVNESIKVPISQNAFDACVSLAFNIGETGFRGSSVVRKANAGDMFGAADAFLLWDKAGGQVLKGLVTRRTAESKQFLSPDGKPPIAAVAPAAAKPSLFSRLKSYVFGA